MKYDDNVGRSFASRDHLDEGCCFAMTVIVPATALYLFTGMSDALLVLVVGTSGFVGGALYMARRQEQRE